MVTFNTDPCSYKTALSLSITILGHNVHGNFLIMVSGSRFLLLLLKFVLNLLTLLNQHFRKYFKSLSFL